MLRLIRYTIWLFIFLLTILVVDTTLTRTRFNLTGLKEGQEFYLDFRKRLIAMTDPAPPKKVEDAIEASQKGIGTAVDQAISGLKKLAGGAEKAGEKIQKIREDQAKEQQSYVYLDSDGTLQFAEKLSDIPENLRSGAEPLKE